MSSTAPESRLDDFGGPLAMLAAFDRDMRNACAALLRLRFRVAEEGADGEARAALRRIVACFDSASVHHADEEDDLFPALMEAMSGSDPVCIRELADALTREHRELERRWGLVRAWLRAVEERASVLPSADPLDAFADLCERHAAREQQELFPMVERLFGTEELDSVRRSMRQRRGMD